MRKNHMLVLWSVLLGMFLASCEGCRKEPAVEDEKPAGNPRRAEPELSEQAKDFAEKRERVRAGETVDFWGNGDKYRAWFDEEGVRHVEIRDSDDQIRHTSETWPDGSKTTRTYTDGIIERQIERKSGEEIQLYDRNRAGFFNERLTQIGIPETRMIRVIRESRMSATEEWTVIKDSVVPPSHGSRVLPVPEDIEKFTEEMIEASKKNSSESSHTSSVLSKVSKSAQPLTGELPSEWHIGHGIHVWFTWDGEPFNGHAQCSHDEVMEIQRALDSVVGGGVDCLSQVNPDAARQLQDSLDSDQKIMISCNLENYPQYSKYDAYTFGPSASSGIGYRILFNKSRPISAELLRALLFHELLHVAEFPFDPDTHDDGVDELYACGRYCGGCANPLNIPSNPNIDCARCADDPLKKASCGVETKLPFGVTPMQRRPPCWTGLLLWKQSHHAISFLR